MTPRLERFHELMAINGMAVPPLADWMAATEQNTDLWPIMRGGEMVGGLLFKGHTLHLVVHPEWQGRWLTRAILRALPHWNNEVELVAPIRTDNTRCIALAKRAGFEFQTDQGMYHLYVRPPHANQPN